MANDRDFIVKNDLQVKGTGLSTFDSGDVSVGGNLVVRADSAVDYLTIDSSGVTLLGPGIFTGDGSGLTNVTADITAASVFDLIDVDSSGITPIQDYVLSWDSANQRFIPSAAVASITIEDSATVIQLINDNIDLGDLRDVDSNVSNTQLVANNDVLKWSSTSNKWIAGGATATAAADVGTTAQRNAISNPADGALFYDTDEAGLYVFDGVDWVEASQDYASFEFIQPGTFSGTVTGTAIYSPTTTISLRNVKAVTADNNHSGISFTINKNGTGLQTFSISANQLRFASEFSSQHSITSSDEVTLDVSVPSGTATILGVEVFYG